MRVLFLNRHDVMDETKHSVGGLVEVFRELAPALKKHKVTVLTYSEDQSQKKILTGPTIASNGIKCYTGPFPKPRLFNLPNKFTPIISLCKNEKIDLIHAHGIYRNGWIAYKVFKKLNIPYIITSHSDVFSPKRIKRKNIINRFKTILEYSAGVTHLAPHMIKYTKDIYDTSNKSKIIGNGINLNNFNPSKKNIEKNYLLAMGRLVPGKGFQILIDCYARLCQKKSIPSLIIAGSGPYKNKLLLQAQKLKLNIVTELPNTSKLPTNTIIFSGYIQNELKEQLLNECLLVLFPTQPDLWEEPFGIIQLEAMKSGKALVASDIAAVKHLETLGLQVLKVPPSDSDAWARAINSLLLDHGKRQNFSQKNLANITRFDWSIIAKEYATFYLNQIS